MIRERSPVHAHKNWTSPWRSLAESAPQQQHLPLNPQVDFESAGERWEKRAKGGRESGLFLFPYFFLCTSLPAYFFSQAELKSKKLEPNILAILNCCIMHFFQNVTKAFSSKGDEIPLIIAL